jgi:hypothetical protein
MKSWVRNQERPSTALRSGHRRSARWKLARSRPARRRGVEQAHARLSGSGAAVAAAGRCDQRRVWPSRSEMPWLQHPSDRCPRHRAATEDHTWSTNSNATCAARTARRFAAIRSSEAIWSRCERRRFRQAIHRRRGGRASGEHHARHPDGRPERPNLRVEP